MGTEVRAPVHMHVPCVRGTGSFRCFVFAFSGTRLPAQEAGCDSMRDAALRGCSSYSAGGLGFMMAEGSARGLIIPMAVSHHGDNFQSWTSMSCVHS